MAATIFSSTLISITGGDLTILKCIYIKIPYIYRPYPSPLHLLPVGGTLFSIALVSIEGATKCSQMEWLTQRVNLCRAAEVACRRCLQDTESHSDWANRVITDVGRVQVHRKK